MTIIVLLILAGVSIQMLTGDNGILQRAGEANDDTVVGQEKEQVELAYISAATKKLGNNIDKDDLQTELNSSVGNNKTLVTGKGTLNAYFYDTNHNYTVNGGTVTRVADGEPEILTTTLGENYQDNWIGKTIQYASDTNNITDWIILGKQTNSEGKNDVIITTKNPVSTLEIGYTLAEWLGYKNKLNNACKKFVGETGTLGTKIAKIKEVRSITLEDINTAVGFNETINSVTISNSNGGFAYPNSSGTGWIKNTDDNYSLYGPITETYSYSNVDGAWKMKTNNEPSTLHEITLGKLENTKYVFSNNISYFVDCISIDLSQYAAFFRVGIVSSTNGYAGLGLCASTASDGFDVGNAYSYALRPVVVLSSETPWRDVVSLIGNYASYN